MFALGIADRNVADFLKDGLQVRAIHICVHPRDVHQLKRIGAGSEDIEPQGDVLLQSLIIGLEQEQLFSPEAWTLETRLHLNQLVLFRILQREYSDRRAVIYQGGCVWCLRRRAEAHLTDVVMAIKERLFSR